MPFKLHPCKFCGKTGHLEFTCTLKPRKPLQAKKPMKKVGKVTIKWLRARKLWINLNPPDHEGYWYCYICGTALNLRRLTLDHKKSRSRSPELRYDLANLAPCCYECNQWKGSRDLIEST